MFRVHRAYSIEGEHVRRVQMEHLHRWDKHSAVV